MSQEWQHIRTIPHEEGDHFELSDIYTHVTMMMEASGVKHQLKSYKDIFCQRDSIADKILLIGEPGYGKTLLVHKITSDWAAGMLPCFDMVFTIKLRYMSRNETILDAILEQFSFPEAINISKEIIGKILNSQSLNVLLILDGLDEVPYHDFPDIETKIKCITCKLLVTTRPHMAKEVKRYFDNVVRILGFTEDDTNVLMGKMRKYFGTNVNVTQVYKFANFDFVFGNPHAKKFHCPFFIYTSILMAMDPDYQEEKKRDDIKLNTRKNPLSTFYFEMIDFITKTNQIQKNMTDHARRQSLLDSMELAYIATVKSNAATLEVSTVKNGDIFKIGTLSGHSKRSRLKQATKVEFIHLSVQESLAVLHIFKKLLVNDTEPLHVFLEQLFRKEEPNALITHNLIIPFTVGKFHFT